jgi:hypothetical protein
MNLTLLLFTACQDQSIQTYNALPTARIMSHQDGDKVLENYTVEFRGTASDANDSPNELEVIWRSPLRELCPPAPPNDDGTTTCSAALELGEEDISLEVRDPGNATASDRVVLEVMPSGPPEGMITSPEPNGKYYSDIRVSLQAIVNDAEADPDDLDVWWESDQDGVLETQNTASPDGEYEDSSYLSQGRHELVLHVEDPQGNETTDRVNLDVGGPNGIPLCGITSPADGTASAVGELVLFRGTASDPDIPANELQASWHSNIGGELGLSSPAADGEVVYGTETLEGGVHTITLSVQDEAGAVCTDFIIYTVSSPPEIWISSPSDGELFSSADTINLSVTVADEEDIPPSLIVTWSSDIDGPIAEAVPGSSGTAETNVADLTPGVHVLTATATDSDGLGSSELVSIEVSDCSANYWYLDADSDGYGEAASYYTGCTPPAGYIGQAGDCDDGDPLQNEGAEEVCNDEDDDCDGLSDEPDAADVGIWYQDADGDSYGDSSTMSISCAPPAPDYVSQAGDCDDSTAAVNPAAEETCEDGLDNDCSGEDDSCQLEFSLSEADSRLYGHSSEDRAGYSLAGVGDTDGDGLDDFLVGAYGDDIAYNSAGVTYLMTSVASGDISMPTAAAAKIYGEAATNFSGFAVSPAGDMDGDGYADILIGSYQEDSGGSDAGAAYLVHGPLSGDVSLAAAEAKLIGEAAMDYAGYSIHGGGDFNGDGTPDVVVGAYAQDSGSPDAGAAYVLFGPLSGEISLGASDFIGMGENLSDYAGYDVAFAGDTDGDGLDDILVGAYGEDSGGNAAGAAYLVRGGAEGALSLQFAEGFYPGEDSFHFAAQRVSSAGDFNGDGLDDILVGAPGEDSMGSSTGAAYVLHGPADGEIDLSDADAKFVGENSLHYAGRGVSEAGDIDGDGAADLAVGASGLSETANAAGAAYVVFGPQTGVLSLAYTYAKGIGEGLGHNAGWTVDGIGDIDGDGLDDILVGAPYENSIGTNAGAAYLLLGSRW